jgi:hypothetical protein
VGTRGAYLCIYLFFIKVIIQGGTRNDPVFDLLIKSLFKLQY